MYCFINTQGTGDFAAEHLHTWGSQSIANIVWAYAKMEVCHDRLLAAVAANLTGLIPHCLSHNSQACICHVGMFGSLHPAVCLFDLPASVFGLGDCSLHI